MFYITCKLAKKGCEVVQKSTISDVGNTFKDVLKDRYPNFL